MSDNAGRDWTGVETYAHEHAFVEVVNDERAELVHERQRYQRHLLTVRMTITQGHAAHNQPRVADRLHLVAVVHVHDAIIRRVR